MSRFDSVFGNRRVFLPVNVWGVPLRPPVARR